MAVKKPETKVIDRESQKKNWFNQFLGSKTLILIGFAWIFAIILFIGSIICAVSNQTEFAHTIFSFLESFAKYLLVAMFSAIGVKVESSV